VIVFNGEIYNYIELRNRLGASYAFRSASDTEVLLAGYLTWGIDELLKRVRGMFAFAIYDLTKLQLCLARDHVGEKPLYYSESYGRIDFASTLPGLMELNPALRTVSSAAVAEYLRYLCIAAPHTVLQDVRKLEPGSYIVWDRDRGCRVKRFWRLTFRPKERLSDWEWRERIGHLMRNSVRARMVADVPVGAFLSGGVDSSLVVSMMSEHSPHPVRTISVGFNGWDGDELPYAGEVAKKNHTEHHELIVSEDVLARLPDIVFAAGEPFADHSLVPSYFMAKRARELVTVALTGDGGDEILAGYETARLACLPQIVRLLPFAVPTGLRRELKRRSRMSGSLARRLTWFLEASCLGLHTFDPVGARSFLHSNISLEFLSHHEDARKSEVLRRWNSSTASNDVERLLDIDFALNLPNMFLHKVDSATMAHGLEARCPLLDVDLIEVLTAMPVESKATMFETKRFGKQLATEYINRRIIYRKKRGFSAPIARWLKGRFGLDIHSLLVEPRSVGRGYWTRETVDLLFSEHEKGICDHSGRIWALCALEMWFREVFERARRK
jgi:asparagine synthase (glutamine-hydrolysing)